MDSCETCRFWRDKQCRRRAPSPRNGMAAFMGNLMGHLVWAQYAAAGIDPEEVAYLDANVSSADSDAAYWPSTEADDWCGEFLSGNRKDVRTQQCQHCDTQFITGSGTGRRSHALYCSDRCRVAAMRKRNKEATM